MIHTIESSFVHTANVNIFQFRLLGRSYNRIFTLPRVYCNFHNINENFSFSANHRNIAIDTRYTPDPQRNHGDIIRNRSTPNRPAAQVKGKIVVGLYNYEARDNTDVSFKKGDRMEVIDDSEGDWFIVVHLLTKERGYIPSNYVAAEMSVESEE